MTKVTPELADRVMCKLSARICVEGAMNNYSFTEQERELLCDALFFFCRYLGALKRAGPLKDEAGIPIYGDPPEPRVNASDVDPTAGIDPKFKWDGNG